VVERCLGGGMWTRSQQQAGSVSRYGSLFSQALQVDRLSAARKNAEKAWKRAKSKPPGLGKKQMQHERIGSVGAGRGGREMVGRWDGCRFLTASTASTASKRIEGVGSPPRSSRSGIVVQARQRKTCACTLHLSRAAAGCSIGTACADDEPPGLATWPCDGPGFGLGWFLMLLFCFVLDRGVR
jgi:hypothetical protein